MTLEEAKYVLEEFDAVPVVVTGTRSQMALRNAVADALMVLVLEEEAAAAYAFRLPVPCSGGRG